MQPKYPQQYWKLSIFWLLSTTKNRSFAFDSELDLRAFWDLDLESIGSMSVEQNWAERLASFNCQMLNAAVGEDEKLHCKVHLASDQNHSYTTTSISNPLEKLNSCSISKSRNLNMNMKLVKSLSTWESLFYHKVMKGILYEIVENGASEVRLADFARLDRFNVEQFPPAIPVQFSAVLQ